MLRQKYSVQRSIRFDEQANNDLAFLSDELGRSVNDLVNFAVEDFLHDNASYFTKLIIEDYLRLFFSGDVEEEIAVIDDIKVHVCYNEDDTYHVEIMPIDEADKSIEVIKEDYEDIDKLSFFLRQYALRHFQYRSAFVQEYLAQRLDYK